MLEIITGNPILAAIAAVIGIYIIFKLIGVFTFLLRLGFAIAIGAALLYYFMK